MKKISFAEYLLFVEAWVLLAFSRLVLIFFPFKKIAPLLGRVMHEEKGVLTDAQQKKQKQISVAILRGCRYAPWRTKCFEQAIAAKIMLRRRGIKSTVYFGLIKNSTDKMQAHAWLKTNDVIVTGGPRVDQYTVVSWFGN